MFGFVAGNGYGIGRFFCRRTELVVFVGRFFVGGVDEQGSEQFRREQRLLIDM